MERLSQARSLDADRVSRAAGDHNGVSLARYLLYCSKPIRKAREQRQITNCPRAASRHARYSGYPEQRPPINEVLAPWDGERSRSEFESQGHGAALPRHSLNRLVLFPHCNPRKIGSPETVCDQQVPMEIHRGHVTQFFVRIEKHPRHVTQTFLRQGLGQIDIARWRFRREGPREFLP